MSDLAIAVWAFPLLLLLIATRTPVGLAMIVVGIAGSYLVNDSFLPIFSLLKSIPYATFANYSLSIIPLFLLMGQFAAYSGLSKSLFETTEVWVGHFKGGLAMATVAACAGFGAICGSSLATTSTLGQVALPQLKKYGYSDALATGCLSAGGTLGILIPPSVILIIYAILTEQNIAKLFAAAFVPGILSALGYMLVIAVYVRLVPKSIAQSERRARAPMSEFVSAFFKSWIVLLLFVVVIGGIYWGIFTPTEGASVGAFGTFLVALFKRALSVETLKRALLETAVTSAMIYFIILGSAVFNSFLAFANLPQAAAAWVTAQNFAPYAVLAIMLLFYFVLGCFMDSLSMILLTIPIFFPIVSGLDFGLSAEEFGIWFGIITLIVAEVGLITPPVGMNLFVINSMSSVPIHETYKGVLPFLISDIIRVVLLILFPAISLFLIF